MPTRRKGHSKHKQNNNEQHRFASVRELAQFYWDAVQYEPRLYFCDISVIDAPERGPSYSMGSLGGMNLHAREYLNDTHHPWLGEPGLRCSRDGMHPMLSRWPLPPPLPPPETQRHLQPWARVHYPLTLSSLLTHTGFNGVCVRVHACVRACLLACARVCVLHHLAVSPAVLAL